MRSKLAQLIALGLLTITSSIPLPAKDLMAVTDEVIRHHLSYLYGSEDLHKGGLDCSGFVRVIFHEACGVDLPDQADKQLIYLREHGQVWDAQSNWSPQTLQPGDLIFFAGPYPLPRESRISHVMVYCGFNIMAGAQVHGRQLDGDNSGVGYYYFGTHPPRGIWGESGDRFIGHMKVFAYGRMKGITAGTPPAWATALAASPPSSGSAHESRSSLPPPHID